MVYKNYIDNNENIGILTQRAWPPPEKLAQSELEVLNKQNCSQRSK